MNTTAADEYSPGAEQQQILSRPTGRAIGFGENSPDAGECEDTRFGILRRMVAELLKDQGAEITVRDRDGAGESAGKPLHQEYGSYDIGPTSDRIFRLAVGIADGDPAKADFLKLTIEQGFQDALDAFGGCLPAASHLTRHAADEKLNRWVIGLSCHG